MRARIAGAFALGFALGALTITVALWATGAMNIRAPAARTPAASAPLNVEQMRAEAQDLARIQPSVPAIDYAQPVPKPSTPAPRGEADRIVPDIPPLRLAMPIADIDPKTLTGTFDAPRNGRKHEALDIMAARGTPVRAVAEGNVAKLFSSKQGGLTVYQFDNTGSYCFYYAHLDRYARGLKEGTLLRRGDVLGYVGSTGDASPDAPHLHFAVFGLGPEKKWWEGTPIDPLPLLQ
jgi:murein DD-endopeptidase MepM/ murein hydrolase activator NlpD